MALATFRIWQAHCLDADYQTIDGSLCSVDVTYDDVDLLVRSIQTVCPAESAWPFAVRLSRPDRTRGIDFIRQPGTDITTPIPTNAAFRLQLGVNPKGQIVGLEGDFAYPAAPWGA